MMTKVNLVTPIFDTAMETITDICNLRLNSWFLGSKVSQGKMCTINRWGGILSHLSMAYLLGYIYAKNYWNWTTTVEIIVGGWVVSFFWDTVYIYIPSDVLLTLPRGAVIFIILTVDFCSYIEVERCNPWLHVASRHISISQLLSSCCYLFTVSSSGLLSLQRPLPASHAHFRHSHIPAFICGVNSSIDDVASCCIPRLYRP